jgi:uncharacterized damage-inducible protein DinB
MSDLILQNGLARLGMARHVTLAMLADVPHDQWCLQAVPGANHTMWIAGHVAATDDMFLSRLTGQGSRLPEGWKELFGTGSKPQPDLAAYPAPEAVHQQLAERRQDLLSWFQARSEEELSAPVPTELQRFANNVADVMASVAWHEGFHVGQLSLVRRRLGLGPKFG